MVAKTFNVNLALADTEYSFNVPANTKYLLLKGRSGLVDIKMAYEQGKSGTTYVTIPATSTKTITGTDNSTMSDIVLYLQAEDTEIVEIETWQ